MSENGYESRNEGSNNQEVPPSFEPSTSGVPASRQPEGWPFAGAQPTAGVQPVSGAQPAANPGFRPAVNHGLGHTGSEGLRSSTDGGWPGPSYRETPNSGYLPADGSAFPAYPGNVPPGAGRPLTTAFPEPKKRRRLWSTAALVAGIVGGLIFGGLIGGITGVTFFNQEDPVPSESQSNGNAQGGDDRGGDYQYPTPPGNQGPSNIDTGTRVSDAPGVVLINSALYSGEGAGTGIIIDASGIVVTNYHVVQGSTTVTVSTADGSDSYEAVVVGHNASEDVAVLQISDAPKGLETVTIAKSTVREGDKVYAQGNGAGQGYITELEGTVTGTGRSITARDSANSGDVNRLTGLIETDADVVSGYSGGPLMNSKHEVIGINTAASTGETSEDVNGYAIPIDSVMSIVDDILAGKSGDGTVIGRDAALGILSYRNSEQQSTGRGVPVGEVIEGSGAEAAGIVKGDIILQFEGQDVNTVWDLADRVKTHSIGDTVTLRVQSVQTGEEKDVDVVLGESTVN